MRKIILALAFLAVAATAMAADVSLTITIPDAYVTRTADALLKEFPDCGLESLTAKQCAEKHIKEYLKKIVRKQERITAREAADETVTDIQF
jgi:TPP-dependent trihydroxycyclohexane-1,2-dione (THcHDO) dehydratase